MSEVNETVLRAKGYDDLLAVVPYRLGFHPADSLVVLAIDGPRQRVGLVLRLDLPAPEHVGPLAEHTIALLAHHQIRRVVLIAYAGDDTVARALVGAMRPALPQAGIELVDAFRADGSRWFPYTCTDACCPPAGTPYDISNHPFVAACVLAGNVALDSREELRRSVSPVTGADRASMDDSYDRLDPQLFAELTAEDADSRMMVRRCTGEVRRLVQRYVAKPRQLSDDEIARLSTQVVAISVRDTAWLLITRETAPQHLSLWQQVLRRTHPELVPAVACLTAFAAWLAGHGALAWCAVERALEEDPDYSWAGLIVDVLERGLSPAAWTAPPSGDQARGLALVEGNT